MATKAVKQGKSSLNRGPVARVNKASSSLLAIMLAGMIIILCSLIINEVFYSPNMNTVGKTGALILTALIALIALVAGTKR